MKIKNPRIKTGVFSSPSLNIELRNEVVFSPNTLYTLKGYWRLKNG